MSKWVALVPPRKGTTDGTGWCLRFAQSFFGAPARYDSAWQAWNAVPEKYGPDVPLPDVPVLVWFSHYGSYGERGREVYANWGHVAVHIKGDAIYSSPASGHGQDRFANVGQIERAFNATYVGWSPIINGLQVAKQTAATPAPEEKDDDMARILNMRTTTDHTKPAATEGKVYLDAGAGVGIKHIANPTHLSLLKRFLADAQGEKFYPSELAVINSYLAPATPIISAATIEAAVTKAIKASGGSVEAAAVAAAVDAVLKDDFAAIPAKVAEEQSKRLQS